MLWAFGIPQLVLTLLLTLALYQLAATGTVTQRLQGTLDKLLDAAEEAQLLLQDEDALEDDVAPSAQPSRSSFHLPEIDPELHDMLDDAAAAHQDSEDFYNLAMLLKAVPARKCVALRVVGGSTLCWCACFSASSTSQSAISL